MLTELEIRALKPAAKPYKVRDSKALFVLVQPTGTKIWLTRYVVDGREGLLSLGIYPDVPTKRAREKRDETRRLVADGIDPSAARKAQKLAQADTFKAIAEEWLEQEAKAEKATITIKTARSRLQTTLYRPSATSPLPRSKPRTCWLSCAVSNPQGHSKPRTGS